MSNDKIYDELCKIYEELKASLRESEPESPTNHTDELASTEVRRLLKNEPDFTKRIATPLPTKRRRRVTLRKVT